MKLEIIRGYFITKTGIENFNKELESFVLLNNISNVSVVSYGVNGNFVTAYIFYTDKTDILSEEK